MTLFRRALLVVSLSLFTCTQVWAVKATSEIVPVKQPDGTILHVRLHGDEHAHYMTTTDDYLVAKDKKDGFYKYVSIDDNNAQALLGVVVARNRAERNAEDLKFLEKQTVASIHAKQLLEKKSNRLPIKPMNKESVVKNIKSLKNQRTKGVEIPKLPSFDTTKRHKFPVILVSFSDVSFKYTAKNYEKWLNEEGYSEFGGTGSVKDYFFENSDGVYAPEFTVYGPVKLPYPVAMFGENAGDMGTDLYAADMVNFACQLVTKQYPDVDFSIYDNDKDGFIDNTNLIFAGYSEATTGIADLIWPHSAAIQDTKLGDVDLYNYTCSAEFCGNSGKVMDGIGTFTHEFCHFLGLMDLYDTDGPTAGTGVDPGCYSIMASGTYNNNSRTPPYLMGFERFMIGWNLDPLYLENAAEMVLSSIATNDIHVIDLHPDYTDGFEYFILENRQRTGWDTYIPAGGLVISHWDFSNYYQELWGINGPNNMATHRCLYLKCADNIDDNLTRYADTYPGRTGNTEFTATSIPNNLRWDGEPAGIDITNIREINGIIHYQVNGGTKVLSQLNTIAPTSLTDTSAEVGAVVINKTTDIEEMGFCWSATELPTIELDTKATVAVADSVTFTVTKLKPSTTYQVRSYMVMSDKSVVYGASIPFITECELQHAPYYSDFKSWTDGIIDAWKIVDLNTDGNTWEYDKYEEAIIYGFDYVNKANDWLISPRIKVPSNGHLFFTRMATLAPYTENLEVWVSTKSKSMNDFFLLERRAIADGYQTYVFEEVDLSLFENKEVYIAFVCRSEKLASGIYLKDVYVTSKLATPQINNFEVVEDKATGDKGVILTWNEVSGADNYLINIDIESDTLYQDMKFITENDFEEKGTALLTSAQIRFENSTAVETIDYPAGITDVLFLYNGSGPFGSSGIKIFATEDGEKWEQLGAQLQINSNDEGECVLSDFMENKKYRKLRIECDWNMRDVVLNYFTIEYNVDKNRTVDKQFVVENDERGWAWDIADYNLDLNYIATLYASDGTLYYDSSNEVRLTTTPSSATHESYGDNIKLIAKDKQVTLQGVEAGARVACYSANGDLLSSSIAMSGNVVCRVEGYTGVLFVRITGNGKGAIFKVMIK